MPSTQHIIVELPDEVVTRLGSVDEAASRLRLYAVLDLLRQKKISQGKASALLQIDRWALMDLMAEFDVPHTDLVAEELAEEVATLHALRSRSR